MCSSPASLVRVNSNSDRPAQGGQEQSFPGSSSLPRTCVQHNPGAATYQPSSVAAGPAAGQLDALQHPTTKEWSICGPAYSGDLSGTPAAPRRALKSSTGASRWVGRSWAVLLLSLLQPRDCVSARVGCFANGLVIISSHGQQACSCLLTAHEGTL